MAIKIVLRNDTKDNWSGANPILAKGEIGFEHDTYKFKIGNGVSSWNGLEYYGDQLLARIETLEKIIENAVIIPPVDDSLLYLIDSDGNNLITENGDYLVYN